MRFNASVGESHEFTVAPERAGERLDVFLADEMIEPSRSFIKRIVAAGLVTTGRGGAKASYRLKAGEVVTVFMPELVEMSAEPEDIPLELLYEDDHMVVVNKQAGLVVHPSPGHETGTLVNALLHRCGDLSGIGGVLRPGIVHRLDMDTTGCIVVAKTDAAHKELAAQFAERTAAKTYLALVNPPPRQPEGKVEGLIGRNSDSRKRHLQAMLTEGGRPSLTLYRTVEVLGDYALVECDLKTGRTHQIRVHMKHLRSPLVCDADYGGRPFAPPGYSGPAVLSRQALHAWKLSLAHPVTGARLDFEAPLPPDLASALALLRAAQ